MSRTSLMTVGLVLILVGVQLNLVESFVLTPRATGFWNERFTDPFDSMPPATGGYTSNPTGSNSAGNARFAPGRFSQQSRSYARNNYPFNTPSYTRGQYNAPTSASATGYSGGINNAATNYGMAAYVGPQKMITAPPWLCWPIIFFGAVTFLYGAALGRS